VDVAPIKISSAIRLRSVALEEHAMFSVKKDLVVSGSGIVV